MNWSYLQMYYGYVIFGDISKWIEYIFEVIEIFKGIEDIVKWFKDIFNNLILFVTTFLIENIFNAIELFKYLKISLIYLKISSNPGVVFFYEKTIVTALCLLIKVFCILCIAVVQAIKRTYIVVNLYLFFNKKAISPTSFLIILNSF